MGNVPISTEETTVYYASDWLVDGGPPFSTMGCREYEVDEDCDGNSVLSMVYDWDLKMWYIIYGLHGADTERRQGIVLMKSTNIHDVAEYFCSYMDKVQHWQQSYENNDWGTE